MQIYTPAGHKMWAETASEGLKEAALGIAKIGRDKWQRSIHKNEIYLRPLDADSAFAIALLEEEMLKASSPAIAS